MRHWGQCEWPSWWRVIARNKCSVAVDLRSEEGQELARALIAKADILIENFRPGTREKWNLDPTELRKANPGLRPEEHPSELQSLMRISYPVFCFKQETDKKPHRPPTTSH